MKIRFVLASLAIFSLAACGSSEDDGSGNGGSGGGVNTANFVGAPGVRIDGVAIYQGPKRTVVVGGELQQSQIPLIAGRDSVFRVWYSTSPDYNGGEVVGQLDIDGGDPIQVLLPALAPLSVEEDMATTVNFGVAGERIGETINFSVGILQEGTADNPIARWPENGPHSMPTEGRRNVLRVVLVPIQYNADGSGRLPDLGEEHLAEIHGRLKALYPVSEVELTVRDPVPFSSAISPTGGGGWNQVGLMLGSLRFQDGASDDVYYYAIFNPADSIAQYCSAGACVLGLTLLNNNPPSTGSALLRGGLGIGFRGFAANTAAHEIGHSHGRRHAPCGPGVQDIDPGFPHAGGQIGDWAYDIAEGKLIEPTMTDIMGYCQNQFVSDYNYIAFHQRGQNVNLEYVHEGPEVTYDMIAVDGEGNVQWGDPIVRTRPYDGTPLTVNASGDDGATTVEARFLRWDHLPGGVLFVPREASAPSKLEFSIDGVKSIARR